MTEDIYINLHLLVSLRVSPPLSVLTTIFLRLPRPVKPEVREVRTGLQLDLAGLCGVKAGPGVEDQRTTGGVGSNVETEE